MEHRVRYLHSASVRLNALLLCLSCASVPPPTVTHDVQRPAVPLAPPPALAPQRLFVDVTEWSGLRDAGDNPGPGLTAADLDDDGDDDLVLGSGPGLEVWSNRGDGSFERLGPVDPGGGYLSFAAQLVGSPALDLVVLRGAGGFELYEGLGGGSFRAAPLPAYPSAAISNGVAFGDFDYTGRLSLYVPYLMPLCGPGVRRQDGSPCRADTTPDQLPNVPGVYLRNTAEGFVDATAASGLDRPTRGQLALAVDLDGDGPLDLFVGTEGDQRDLVFLGDAKGRFHEGRKEDLGLDLGTSCMGADWADIDGDGDAELFVSDYLREGGSPLWVRSESGRYVNEAKARGLGELSQFSVWGVGLYDFDSDGDEDLLCVNSIPRTHGAELTPQERTYFANDGTGHFTRQVATDSALDTVSEARGAAFADFDLDGDVDGVVASRTGGVQLLRNDLPQGAWTWLTLDYPWYRPVVGARVRVTAGGRVFTRWVTGTAGFAGSSTLGIHVGLGEADAIEQIEVRWPHGETQRFEGPLPVRTHLKLAYAAP